MTGEKLQRAIIVALDGTLEAERALAPARELALALGAPVVLVRSGEAPAEPLADPGPLAVAAVPGATPIGNIAVTPILPAAPAPQVANVHPVPDPADHPVENSETTGYLNIVANDLSAQGLHVEQVAASGDPAEALIAEARVRDAAMIILARQRRSGLGKLIFGSVSETVLRDAPCPVLVIPVGDAS